MTNNEYIENVLKTESNDFQKIRERFGDDGMLRILHASMGIVTEAGELQDALKKTVYYGKPLDLVNVEEEAGDLLWYLAILINELGSSFEKIQERNIEKLKARYGEKFNEDGALNRDLKKERDVLENQ